MSTPFLLRWCTYLWWRGATHGDGDSPSLSMPHIQVPATEMRKTSQEMPFPRCSPRSMMGVLVVLHLTLQTVISSVPSSSLTAWQDWHLQTGSPGLPDSLDSGWYSQCMQDAVWWRWEREKLGYGPIPACWATFLSLYHSSCQGAPSHRFIQQLPPSPHWTKGVTT